MEFTAESNNDICIAAASGELTIYFAADFKKELDKVLKKCSSIKLDLSGVSEIDTSCFQLLMQAHQYCLEKGKDFELVVVSPAVIEVLEIFGMQGHFGKLGGVEAA